MTHKLSNLFLAAVLLLAGCSGPNTIEAPGIEVKNEEFQTHEEWLNSRDPRVDKCMEVINGKDPDVSFVYVYEDSNEEGEWQPITNLAKDAEGYIANGTHVYVSFDRWAGENVTNVVVEYNTPYFKPSADWNRIDNYCFGNDGNVIEMYSSLNLLEDNLKLTRAWTYNEDGSIQNKVKELTDLKMKDAFDLSEISFLDRPPYLATNLEDLIEHLELPDGVN